MMIGGSELKVSIVNVDDEKYKLCILYVYQLLY